MIRQSGSSLTSARVFKGGVMIKQIFGRLGISAAALAVMTVLASSAYAQQSDAADDVFVINRVGTIDLVEVLRQSEATDTIRSVLDEKRAQFQEEFTAREVELMAREKTLQGKRDVMSKEAFDEEVRLFRAEVADIQREIQQKRKSLDNAFQQAQDKLRELAVEIVGDVAKERKLDLVLNKNNVLIFRNQLDLTDVVLERLNERTKDARFEVTEIAPPKEN